MPCRLESAPDGSSFVTHWAVVYKPFMLKMLAQLSSGSSSRAVGAPWAWHILDSLDPLLLNQGFSEYATYISWVRQHFPKSQVRAWVRARETLKRLRVSFLCAPGYEIRAAVCTHTI